MHFLKSGLPPAKPALTTQIWNQPPCSLMNTLRLIPSNKLVSGDERKRFQFIKKRNSKGPQLSLFTILGEPLLTQRPAWKDLHVRQVLSGPRCLCNMNKTDSLVFLRADPQFPQRNLTTTHFSENACKMLKFYTPQNSLSRDGIPITPAVRGRKLCDVI